MKKTRINLTLVLILLGSVCFAQNRTKSFPKEVNAIKMTDAGVAIVATDDALYGIDGEGNELWKNEKLKKMDAERVEVLSGSEYVFVSDKGLLSRNRVLNVLTGEEVGNHFSETFEQIFAARVIHGTNQLWVMPDPGKLIEVWDLETNTHRYDFKHYISTNQSATMTATFAGTQPITYTGDNSAVIHFSYGNLANYDLTNGEILWWFDWEPYKIKKYNKEKGYVESNPSKGFSIMKVDEAANTLYFPFVDQLISINLNDGSSNWPVKTEKIGKVKDMFITDEGILVLTWNGLDLIDKSTGLSKWGKKLKVKGIADGLLVEDGDDFYMVSKSNVVKVDITNKSVSPVTEKIKFEGGESMSNIEVVDDRIILGSSQNVVAVDKNSGDILHQSYFKAPGSGIATIATKHGIGYYCSSSYLKQL